MKAYEAAGIISSEQGNIHFQMEMVRGFVGDVRGVLASEGYTNLEKGEKVVSDVSNQCIRDWRIHKLYRGQRVNVEE